MLQRSVSADVSRGILILAVVVGHITSYPAVALSRNSSIFPLYSVINSSLAFIIPAFIYLSSRNLTIRHFTESESRSWWPAFWRRRITSILVPYVAWSLFYIGVRFLPNTTLFDLNYALRLVYSGKAWAHLYFLPLILQFYIIFPPVLALVTKKCGTVWFVAITVQIIYYLYNEILTSGGSESINFANYTIYWVLGILSGFRNASGKGKTVIGRQGLLTSIIIFAASVITYCFLKLEMAYGIRHADILLEIIRIFLSVSACIAIIPLSGMLSGKHLSIWLAALGKMSMGVYLIHPFFLHLFRTATRSLTAHPMFFHLSIWLGGIFAIFASLALTMLILRHPILKWLLGSIPRQGATQSGASRTAGL